MFDALNNVIDYSNNYWDDIYAYSFLYGDRSIDTMLVVKIDIVHTESVKAIFTAFLNIFTGPFHLKVKSF